MFHRLKLDSQGTLNWHSNKNEEELLKINFTRREFCISRLLILIISKESDKIKTGFGRSNS